MANALERWLDSKKMNPFREMSPAFEPMDQIFNEFMNMKKSPGLPSTNFSPTCEIAEEDNTYVLKFDLPGVTKDQVRVEAENDQLTVTAERKEEKKNESKKKFYSEIYYGSYTRSFTLPGPIDDKKIEAKFENGVLTVKVPKTESLKVKSIPVQ